MKNDPKDTTKDAEKRKGTTTRTVNTAPKKKKGLFRRNPPPAPDLETFASANLPTTQVQQPTTQSLRTPVDYNRDMDKDANMRKLYLQRDKTNHQLSKEQRRVENARKKAAEIAAGVVSDDNLKKDTFKYKLNTKALQKKQTRRPTYCSTRSCEVERAAGFTLPKDTEIFGRTVKGGSEMPIIPGTASFKSKHKELGFDEVEWNGDMTKLQPGDRIIQERAGHGPHHSLTYGVDENGVPKVYHTGDPHGKTFRADNFSDYQKKAGRKESFRAYRYVGNTRELESRLSEADNNLKREYPDYSPEEPGFFKGGPVTTAPSIEDPTQIPLPGTTNVVGKPYEIAQAEGLPVTQSAYSASPNQPSTVNPLPGLAQKAANALAPIAPWAPLAVAGAGLLYQGAQALDRGPQSQYGMMRENNRVNVQGYYEGGAINDKQLSSDAVKIQGNPQQKDGNVRNIEGTTARFHHDEVVSQLPDGSDFAFSTKYTNPQSGNTIAKDAEENRKAYGKVEKQLVNQPNDKILQRTMKLYDEQLMKLANLNETMKQQDAPQKDPMAFFTGGQLPTFNDGGQVTDPPYDEYLKVQKGAVRLAKDTQFLQRSVVAAISRYANDELFQLPLSQESANRIADEYPKENAVGHAISDFIRNSATILSPEQWDVIADYAYGDGYTNHDIFIDDAVLPQLETLGQDNPAWEQYKVESAKKIDAFSDKVNDFDAKVQSGEIELGTDFTEKDIAKSFTNYVKEVGKDVRREDRAEYREADSEAQRRPADAPTFEEARNLPNMPEDPIRVISDEIPTVTEDQIGDQESAVIDPDNTTGGGAVRVPNPRDGRDINIQRRPGITRAPVTPTQQYDSRSGYTTLRPGRRTQYEPGQFGRNVAAATGIENDMSTYAPTTDEVTQQPFNWKGRVGDVIQGLGVLGSFRGLMRGPDRENLPMYANMQVSEVPQLNQARNAYNSLARQSNAGNYNTNRYMMQGVNANYMNQLSQIGQQTQQTNLGLAQQTDNLNTQQATQQADINARNKGAYNNSLNNAFGTLRTLGQEINSVRANDESIAMMGSQFDVFNKFINDVNETLGTMGKGAISTGQKKRTN